MNTDRTQRLRQLMEEHRLKAADVGEILERAPATVRIWRVGGKRPIPPLALALLEERLKARGVTK